MYISAASFSAMTDISFSVSLYKLWTVFPEVCCQRFKE